MFKSYRFQLCRFVLPACFLAAILSPVVQGQSPVLRSHAEVNEMQQVENDWSTAVTKRDQYALENVLSPQIIDIAATGDVTTRNQDIAKLFAKDALPAWLKQTVVDVRTLSEGILLVNGTYVMHWVTASGASTGTPPSVDEKGVFTHIFQMVNGRWVCVNSQRTVVADVLPPVKAKTSAPKTKSNAAEPFHIPLVYKGPESTQPTPTPAPAPQ